MLDLQSKELLMVAGAGGQGAGFVAVANGSNIGAYSKDGKKWEQFTLPQSTNWDGIGYNKGRFVVCSGYTYGASKKEGAYSDDGGKTWSSVTLPGTYEGKILEGTGGKFFILEGQDFLNTNSKGHIWWSDDGIAWNACGNFNMIMPEGICFGNGLYVIGGYLSYGGLALYSSDGKTWSGNASLNTLVSGLNPIFVDDTFYMIMPSTSYKSTNGKNWSSFSITGVVSVVNSKEGVRKIIKGDGIYLATYYNSSSGSNITKYGVSNNLVNWDLLTLPVVPAAVCFGNGLFVLIGTNTDKTYISKDGRTWTLGGTLPKSQNWSCVKYGKDE